MADKDHPVDAMSRRRFLKSSAAAGAGLGLGSAGLLAPAWAQQPVTIGFAGWAFEPQVVEASVKRFMAENPGIRVNYTPLDLQLYPEKMVALFNAGTQPDAFYVRDTHLGAWVEAGWLQPIDGLPGLEHGISSNEAFLLEKFPERMLIVGGGYVALEFANIFHGLGAKTRIVHRGEQVLRIEADAQARLAASLEHLGELLEAAPDRRTLAGRELEQETDLCGAWDRAGPRSIGRRCPWGSGRGGAPLCGWSATLSSRP